MKTLLVSFKIFIVLLALTFISSNTFAQKKPDPIKSPTIEMLIGNWQSSPYEMMGSKWSGTANHYWKFNGQYMFIDIDETDDKGNTYKGQIVIVPTADGSFTGYGFDEWGGVSTIKGKADGNKISAESMSAWGPSTREIVINGNTMDHVISFTMKGQDGKEIPQKINITYTKK